MSESSLLSHGSPFCKILWLTIDPVQFDFHIDFHTKTPTFALALMRERAFRLGYVEDIEDDQTDPYDQAEMLDDCDCSPVDSYGMPTCTMFRLYLAHKDAIPDTQEWMMPDLSQTAYGPHSGFMEAV